ncbi:MAG: hypothetical protein NWF00_07570 [Candidatus Bathyarchaeota archaeon]|nr:hypothetical protein [Candidatus Bathyarchaeota archaeon]
MLRREAIQLFQEICKCIPEQSMLRSVFLKPHTREADSTGENFELWINVALDETSLKYVKQIVKNHKLSIGETSGSLVIYKPEARRLVVLA